MAEVAQANRNYEDRIEDLLGIQQMLAQKQEEFKQQVASCSEKISNLEEENKSLKISLEEERKEHEDLLFTYEEEKINQADLQASLCNSENGSGDILALRTLVQQYTEKLKQRETEIASLKEKSSRQQIQLEEALSDNNQNQVTIKKLQSEVDSNQQKIRSLEESLAAEIVHSQHAIANVERVHAHKLREVSTFTQKVEDLSSTLINTMKQYEELKAENIKLEDKLNETILAKTVEPGALESRLKMKEEETGKLQQHIAELQQLNASLTSIWEFNVKTIEDNFKTKEMSLEENIKELEEKLQTQKETSDKTIQNLQLQLGLKLNQ
ncbi:unnamed protein product [Allacma fusca]|uniref:Uncharacterized protein n=1 Tax=Allacma fusca TaxID=39272 RepID=A0A8J2P5Q2_9HEXA|nr:unnamed protein product [Allacma fusca]